MNILATHVGSLPGSEEVVDDIFARERNEPFEQGDFDAAMTWTVSETVKRHVEADVNIVSDAETSKIIYATKIKQRYIGLDGATPPKAPVAGALTKKVMRALWNLAPGFLAYSIGLSDCFVRVRTVNQPVRMMGIDVGPGDLIHADRHGAVLILPEVVGH